MRKYFAIFAFLFTALLVRGAETNSVWLTDLAKAKAQAKKENKVVLLDFTGSDWCPPCMALRRNVFDSHDFLVYAKSHLVLVEVDDPADDKKITAEQRKINLELADKFKIEGRPTIVALDGNGKEIYRQVGYDRSDPEEYIKNLNSNISKN